MIETIQSGKPITNFLKRGDRVEIEMRDAKNHSIFGRIEQEVAKA
jgi:fumarylacetoacetate (FAA) hydrolase